MRITHRIAVAAALAVSAVALSLGARAQEIPWSAPVAAISESGERLATLGAGGKVRIWKAGDEEADVEFESPERTRALAFVQDGKRLVVEQTGGFDGPNAVHLHDAATGERVHTWKDAESRRPMQGGIRIGGALPAQDAIHLTYLGMHNESVSVETFEPVAALENLASAPWVRPVGDGTSVLMPPPEGVGVVALVDVASLEIAWRRGNAYGFEKLSKTHRLGIGTTLRNIRPADGAGCVVADVEVGGRGTVISIAFELKTGEPRWVLETGRVIAIPSGDTPRLVARLADHHALVDGRTGKTLRKLDGLPHDHGALLVPDGKTVYGIDPSTGDVTRIALDD